MPRLAENIQVVPGAAPVDLSSATHNLLTANGDWVNMENFNRCLILFLTGIGSAGDDYTLTLQQATDNAGSGAKALNFLHRWYKQGGTAISGVAQFTHSTTASSNTFTDAADAENESLLMIDVDAADLDLANDFTHIQASIDDVGTAEQLGSMIYILYEARYAENIVVGATD